MTRLAGDCLITAEQYSKLQKKRARNSVPKCPCKLLQPADRPMAGSSSLEGHFGTGLRARFSSAWSNVECACIKPVDILKNWILGSSSTTNYYLIVCILFAVYTLYLSNLPTANFKSNLRSSLEVIILTCF